jgi:transposase InsO family protein
MNSSLSFRQRGWRGANVGEWPDSDHCYFVIQAVRHEHLAAERGLPATISVDHGTEFTSRALDALAKARGVQLHFIRPGKPTTTPSLRASTAGSSTNVAMNTGFAPPPTRRS